MKNERIYKFIKCFTNNIPIYTLGTLKAVLWVTLGGAGRARDSKNVLKIPNIQTLFNSRNIYSVSDCIDLQMLPPPSTSEMAFLESDHSKKHCSSGKSELAFTVYQILTFYWCSQFLLREGCALIQLVTITTFLHSDKSVSKTWVHFRGHLDTSKGTIRWINSLLTRPQVGSQDPAENEPRQISGFREHFHFFTLIPHLPPHS